MPMMKPLVILSTMALLGTTMAHAQDMAQDATQDGVTTQSSPFVSADNDLNGELSFGEFTAYVEQKARGGDATYAEILASGDYDLAFAERDLDADGTLDLGELGEVKTDMDGEWSSYTDDDMPDAASDDDSEEGDDIDPLPEASGDEY